MVTLHRTVGWILIIGNGLAGAWVLAANWLPRLRVRPMWWFVIAVQVVVAIQVILGVILWNTTDEHPPGMHQFYGFVALASVGLIYSYRQQIKDRQYLLYGLGCLFIMGLGIRAMQFHL